MREIFHLTWGTYFILISNTCFVNAGLLNNHGGIGGNLHKGDDDIALSDHEHEGELGSDADNEDISDVNDDSRHQNSKSTNPTGADIATPVAASGGTID